MNEGNGYSREVSGFKNYVMHHGIYNAVSKKYREMFVKDEIVTKAIIIKNVNKLIDNLPGVARPKTYDQAYLSINNFLKSGY